MDILYDCDPGQDDAMALLTALGNPDKVKVLCVSTVGGNQNINLVTQNAGYLLAFCKQHIPLVQGQAGPLLNQLHVQAKAHGSTGMDGSVSLNKYAYPVEDDNAICFMANMLKKQSQKVTIVATGPLTNIALLIKTFPEIIPKIAKIVIMGGGIDHGNVTDLAEFNIWTDPEAAQIVFSSSLEVIMAGLDVTEKITITKKEIASLQFGGPASKMAGNLLHFYQKSGEQFGFTAAPVHDLVAMEYAIWPEFFEAVPANIKVNTNHGDAYGQTYIAKGKDENKAAHNVLIKKMTKKLFFALLQKSLQFLDQKLVH